MSRILKVYDKSIFHISEHFIKVEIPFSTEQKEDTNIIANGNDVGNDIGNEKSEEMETLEILKRKSICHSKTNGKTNEHKSEKGSSSYKGTERRGKNS